MLLWIRRGSAFYMIFHETLANCFSMHLKNFVFFVTFVHDLIHFELTDWIRIRLYRNAYCKRNDKMKMRTGLKFNKSNCFHCCSQSRADLFVYFLILFSLFRSPSPSHNIISIRLLVLVCDRCCFGSNSHNQKSHHDNLNGITWIRKREKKSTTTEQLQMKDWSAWKQERIFRDENE